MDVQNYWNMRGKESFNYKGEFFYTITPIPYYYRRRDILLNALSKEIATQISNKKSLRIHDFGCGDGWYLNYFHKIYKDFANIQFSGFDISESFIQKAKSILSDDISLYCGEIDDAYDNDTSFNLIYSISVFAHISNKDISNIFNCFMQRLASGGRLVLFEQTSGGKNTIEGSTYIRRLASEYEEIAKRSGFVLTDKFAVDFTVHRLFERYIAKKLYKHFHGNTQTEQRISANKNIFFRLLSNIACMLSFNPIKRKDKNYWGNTFFVFEKV